MATLIQGTKTNFRLIIISSHSSTNAEYFAKIVSVDCEKIGPTEIVKKETAAEHAVRAKQDLVLGVRLYSCCPATEETR